MVGWLQICTLHAYLQQLQWPAWPLHTRELFTAAGVGSVYGLATMHVLLWSPTKDRRQI